MKGFLRAFARTAASGAQFLNKMAALGIPMVGVDPSLVLCYRDEYVKALGPARGDFQVLLPQEWLLSSGPASQGRSERAGAGRALVSVCPLHREDRQALDPRRLGHLVPAFWGQLAACVCGLLRHGRHLWSRRQTGGELQGDLWSQLGRALARLPKDRCLATGYSCRSQVKRMEEKLKHPLQALLELL